jgi:hypothetical protein
VGEEMVDFAAHSISSISMAFFGVRAGFLAFGFEMCARKEPGVGGWSGDGLFWLPIFYLGAGDTIRTILSLAEAGVNSRRIFGQVETGGIALLASQLFECRKRHSLPGIHDNLLKQVAVV